MSPKGIKEPPLPNAEPIENMPTQSIKPKVEYIDLVSEVTEPTQPSEYEITIPTPTALPSPVTRIVDIRIEFSSPFLETLFRRNMKDKLLIIVPACNTNCTTSEIDEALGKAFEQREYWTAVQIGQILYTHSGWSQEHGPEFGDVFRRAFKYNSDIEMWLDNENYPMENHINMSSESIDGNVPLESLFAEVKSDDLIVVTCLDFVPGGISPKIISHMKLKLTS